MPDNHTAGIRDYADIRPGQVPLLEDAFDFLLAALVNDDQHPLLRFAEHDLVAGHAWCALGDLVELDLDARAGTRGGFTG